MKEACPNCSNNLTIADTRPGNVLVCGQCVEILVVGADMAAHHATAQDIASFPPEMRAEIEQFQKALLARKTEGTMPS